MLYSDLTRVIIGCAFEVQNELGVGFLESVYEKAMVVALKDAGILVQAQAPVTVTFRNSPVGAFYADLLVPNKVIIELKAVERLNPSHKAQVINYLNATGIPVGLLINFGNPKVEFQRFTRSIERTEP